MPEGPEVKIIVDQLNNLLINTTINEFVINSGRYSKKAPDNYQDFVNSLPLKILGVKCKGKFIYFECEKNWKIWNTLGMTGGWKLNKEKYGHLSLITDKVPIYFDDYRNFGTVKFSNSISDFNKKMKDLGVDVLTNDFTVESFFKIINNKRYQKKTLPEFLMNQKLFSGIGNYLKSEILYQSKISPHRIIEEISEEEKEIIFNSTKQIAHASYKLGGASVRDYSNIEDQKGKYTDLLKVYAQKNDPLGNKVKKETTKDKRTTHWVPEIQL